MAAIAVSSGLHSRGDSLLLDLHVGRKINLVNSFLQELGFPIINGLDTQDILLCELGLRMFVDRAKKVAR
jgi:hypothetical protein